MNNMMTEQIWDELEKRISANYPLLGFHSILSDKEINEKKLPEADKKYSVYIFHYRNLNGDIKVGSKYNVIFRRKAPKEYKKINAEVDFAELNPGKPISVIPAGYGGVCRINFAGGVPKELKLLEVKPAKRTDYDQYEIMFLTTQEVMDVILQILEAQGS